MENVTCFEIRKKLAQVAEKLRKLSKTQFCKRLQTFGFQDAEQHVSKVD